MPIFEYVCNDCGCNFEVLVLAAAKEKGKTCPACASLSIRKKLSTFAVNTSQRDARPGCATGCDGGFEHGSCGSGLCGCGGAD
jgi:putative FmdB family regulatory protein